MKKFMERLSKNEKGFTLIELIIVIAILAIIAAIAIPNILNAVDNSRKTADVANAKIIANAVATVKAKNDAYGSQVGMYNIDASGGAFADAVNAELGSVPTPKYKGAAGFAENVFFYTINAGGIVTVYASSAAITEDTASTFTLPANNIQVYPASGATYTNN